MCFFQLNAFPPKLKSCSLFSVYPVGTVSWFQLFLLRFCAAFLILLIKVRQAEAQYLVYKYILILYAGRVIYSVALPCLVIYDALVASSAVLRWSSWENSWYLLIFFFWSDGIQFRRHHSIRKLFSPKGYFFTLTLSWISPPILLFRQLVSFDTPLCAFRQPGLGGTATYLGIAGKHHHSAPSACFPRL